MHTIKVLQEQKGETGRVNTEWVFALQVHPRNSMSDGIVTKVIKILDTGKKGLLMGSEPWHEQPFGKYPFFQLPKRTVKFFFIFKVH